MKERRRRPSTKERKSARGVKERRSWVRRKVCWGEYVSLRDIRSERVEEGRKERRGHTNNSGDSCANALILL
jgi:hypothetical protein